MTNTDLKLFLDSLREEIKTGHTATRAVIMSEINRIDVKADSIIKHQKDQNGKLGKHEDRLVCLETFKDHSPASKLTARQVRIVGALDKKVFWTTVAVLLIGIGVLTSWMYHNVDIIRTVKNNTGIELIDKK